MNTVWALRDQPKAVKFPRKMLITDFVQSLKQAVIMVSLPLTVAGKVLYVICVFIFT